MDPPVKSDNMMFTNAVAAFTVMLNALATEIATCHREESIAPRPGHGSTGYSTTTRMCWIRIEIGVRNSEFGIFIASSCR